MNLSIVTWLLPKKLAFPISNYIFSAFRLLFIKPCGLATGQSSNLAMSQSAQPGALKRRRVDGPSNELPDSTR